MHTSYDLFRYLPVNLVPEPPVDTNQPKTTWEDVKKADITRINTKIGNAIMGFLDSNRNETLQTVELRLRKERCFTYLVANSERPPEKLTVRDINNKPCKYHLSATTKNTEIALKEKYSLVPNDQINFERLRETGFLMSKVEDVPEVIDNNNITINELGLGIYLDHIEKSDLSMNMLSKHTISELEKFLSIKDDEPQNEVVLDSNHDLFVGANKSVTITLDNGTHSYLRDIVVHGHLKLISSDPSNHNVQGKLTCRDIFTASGKTDLSNVVVNAQNMLTSSRYEFYKAINSLLQEWSEYQAENISKMGLVSILVD